MKPKKPKGFRAFDELARKLAQVPASEVRARLKQMQIDPAPAFERVKKALAKRRKKK